MIVKNEAHLIINTFDHLSRFIKFDYWAINDNGSTDGTQDLIRAYFKAKGIPGILDETPWQDFAFNRTVAFRAAFGKTDYAFVWDADDEIHGDFRFPENLTADAYLFTYGNAFGARYSRCQLFKNNLRWKYVGVIHECPMSDEPGLQQIQGRVEGDYYFISGRTGARNRDPDKYLNDALILEKAYHEAVEKNDGIMHRYAFYTAQSYNSCGRHEKSIEFYKKVLTLENWAQEKYMSCIEIYDQYAALKKEEEGLRYLVESFRYDSQRVEGIYRLIKYYCIHGPVEVALAYYTLIQNYMENDYATDNIATRLFAKKEEFDFYLPYYMIIVSERVKRFDIFKKMYEIIFRQGYLHAGAWWIHNLFHNLQFGIPPGDKTFVESALTYVDTLRKHGVTLNQNHYEILDRLVAASRSMLACFPPSEKVPVKKDRVEPVRVMLTVTTCKRLALFKETMNSMLRTWQDISAVDYFFCVDDNSSAEDRQVMRTDYPFFDYYMKEPAEKGHRESMNIIWNKLREIRPTYWIHMEDDWLYFKQESYVSKGIALLEKYEQHNIHQLVFNREYGLMLKDMNRVSVEPLETGVVLHSQKDVQGPNCAYWPHYSIQPSIVRTRVILELGNYDSPNTFFERDYANKYGAAGYKTMFFDGIHSLHIGKQHWEKDGQNAYALNGIGQFGQSQRNENPTLVITEIPKNEPLQGSMAEHLEQILEKITAALPFGLIRPSDGEHKILSNTTLTNCDNWTFTKDGALQQQLMSAIQTVNQNLYIGIPCNTCNLPWNCTQAVYDDYTVRWGVPKNQQTYANVFGNSNWSRWSSFLKKYAKGFYVVTSGQNESPLQIKGRLLIDDKLVNRWDDLSGSETARVLDFVADKNGELICFSAGPLSKVWIPLCMARNPTNMYVDAGASIDIFTKGSINRYYTNPQAQFANDVCHFNDRARAKNLIYAAVFNDAKYFELLRILLSTTKFFSKTDAFDILVLTDAALAPKVRALGRQLQLPVFVWITEPKGLQDALCARFTIFGYPDISGYDRLLYLDTDIVIQGDLTPLFDQEIEDKIYALPEGTIEHEYHGGWFFDFATIDKDTPGMNSGILLFKNTETVRGIFAAVNAHSKQRSDAGETMPITGDQPFLNYHAIRNGHQDTQLLTKYALIYCMDPPPPPSAPTTVTICHFVWPLGDVRHKQIRMINHTKHVFENYAAVTEATPVVGNPLLGKRFRWGTDGEIVFELSQLRTTWATGTYKWLDTHTVEASWAGYEHILRFNDRYTGFISIRKKDFDCVIGTRG